MTLNFVEFENDGFGWTGIDSVLQQMLDWLNNNLAVSVGAKLTASDARHNPARGAIFYGLEPFTQPAETRYQIRWYDKHVANADASGMRGAIDSLYDDEQKVALPLMTAKQSGGNEHRNSFLIYPDSMTKTQSRESTLNPQGWMYKAFTEDSGLDQMFPLVERMRAFLWDNMDASFSAKVTGDDRASGPAWGYVFFNPTSILGDIQYVTNPSSWGLLSWHILNPADPEIPDLFVAFLDGWPMESGERLTWAQACSSKILFTNRQEGDGYGATLSLFYPRL